MDRTKNIEWGYEGDIGPNNWSSLDTSYQMCGYGTRQSPIDLTGAEKRELPDIIFNYKSSAINILNNGHAIQVNVDPGSSNTIGNEQYELIQFHFHHGSEHTVEGSRLSMELHFVHGSDEGKTAVVAVLLDKGEVNEAYETVWRHLPKVPTPETVVPGSVDLEALLPLNRTTWRYIGSLTTPPCTEGVQWFVMTDPVMLSAEQIDSYGAIISNSFRPVQPLNGRSLAWDKDN